MYRYNALNKAHQRSFDFKLTIEVHELSAHGQKVHGGHKYGFSGWIVDLLWEQHWFLILEHCFARIFCRMMTNWLYAFNKPQTPQYGRGYVSQGRSWLLALNASQNTSKWPWVLNSLCDNLLTVAEVFSRKYKDGGDLRLYIRTLTALSRLASALAPIALG